MSTDNILKNISRHEQELRNLATDIWKNAEIGLKEEYACSRLSDYLTDQGFVVESNVAGMATAFAARWGEGKPVISFLAEYDALEELSQKAGVAHREAATEGAPGHGCGHNLLGVGAAGAALALKEELESSNQQGTVILYGCPAEETFIGKAYMAKSGVFDEADVAITWHPDRVNMVVDEVWQAVSVAKFNFKGITSHAATEPEKGRSALDAVELMNVGVNYLREHVIDQARMHYAITHGGGIPNTVPEKAQVWYYVRAPRWQQVKEVYDRVVKVANGAAMMTETELDIDFITASPDILPNDVLSQLMSDCMQELPPIEFTESDYNFSREISKTFAQGQDEAVTNRLRLAGYEKEVEDKLLFCDVAPFKAKHPDIPGSSDVGNVSWKVPTVQVLTTCNPYATTDHSWQYTASAGMNIGMTGMLYAAGIMGLTGLKLVQNTDILTKAKEEFEKRANGQDINVLIPDGKMAPVSNH